MKKYQILIFISIVFITVSNAQQKTVLEEVAKLNQINKKKTYVKESIMETLDRKKL